MLITTDVWARGIDVQQVSLVINYDLPAYVVLRLLSYIPCVTVTFFAFKEIVRTTSIELVVLVVSGGKVLQLT